MNQGDLTAAVRTAMTVLGINVGKEYIDCELLGDKRAPKKVTNSVRGFEQVVAWLRNRKIAKVHACMEATGGWSEELAFFLHEYGHVVSIVNPMQIRAFGQSELSRTKTDRADAGLNARFCAAMHPAAWEPPKPAERRLKQLVRRRRSLVEMPRTQEENRLESPAMDHVRDSIFGMIDVLDEQIKELDAQIKATIDEDDDLKGKRDLIESIDGIGPITSATILGETPHIENFQSSKALTAFAGLCPHVRQSGTSIRSSRTTKIGNRAIRKTLYMAAITALRSNAVIQAFAARLRERGKRPMEVIVAAMRKLLVLVFGVLKPAGRLTPRGLDGRHGISTAVRFANLRSGWTSTTITPISEHP
jgi:transposase